MPTYEYFCSFCKFHVELIMKDFNPPKNKLCPKCGKMAPRIVSRTHFVLSDKCLWPTRELTKTEVHNQRHARNVEFEKRKRELDADNALPEVYKR